MLRISMIAWLIVCLASVSLAMAHWGVPVREVEYVIEGWLDIIVEARHVVTRRAFRTIIVLADPRAAVA